MEEVVTSEYILFQTSIKNEKKELTMMQKLKSKQEKLAHIIETRCPY